MSCDKLRLKVLEQELCDVLYQLNDRELLVILEKRSEETDRLRSLLRALDEHEGVKKCVEAGGGGDEG